MTKHFFITGLPRSRTAWFANMFTWGDSFCWHEKPDPRMANPEGFERLGVSDPALVLQWRHIRAVYPEAPWVVIDRNIHEDLVTSCQRIHPDITESALVEFKRELSDLAYETKAFVCGFEDIGPFMCRQMAKYLSIDIGPDARLIQLLDMNVQIHPPVLRRRLESLKCQPVVDAKEAA